MTSTDTSAESREAMNIEFEQWKKGPHGLGLGLSRNNAPGDDLDGYQDFFTQGQWLAWQAAESRMQAKIDAAVLNNAVMPSVKTLLRVEFFYQAGDVPFICGADGHVTVRSLEQIEAECQSEMSEAFDKGDGSYLFEAKWFSGQYGEYGQCELPPSWELSLLSFKPEHDAQPSTTNKEPENG